MATGKCKLRSTSWTKGSAEAAAAGKLGAAASNALLDVDRQATRRGRTNGYPRGPARKLARKLAVDGIESLKNLTAQEQLAVQGRFLWGMSLEEIGAQLLVSKQRAGQLINSAARKQEEP